MTLASMYYAAPRIISTEKCVISMGENEVMLSGYQCVVGAGFAFAFAFGGEKFPYNKEELLAMVSQGTQKEKK